MSTLGSVTIGPATGLPQSWLPGGLGGAGGLGNPFVAPPLMNMANAAGVPNAAQLFTQWLTGQNNPQLILVDVFVVIIALTLVVVGIAGFIL